MKIVLLFLIFFCYIKTELNILQEEKPLNLIDDDDLYYDHEKGFNKKTYQTNLEILSRSYKKCLQKHGIKKSSFDLCVGENYHKIDRDMRQELQLNEASLKESFAINLKPICKEDNEVLCSDLIDTLNMSIVKLENPVNEIKKKSEDFNLNGKDERILNEVIFKLKEDYDMYQDCEYLMNKMKERALHEVSDFIKGSDLDVKFNYEDMPEEEEQFNEGVHEQVDESDFHQNMAKRVHQDLSDAFSRVNGPVNDDLADHQDHQLHVIL